MDLRPTCSQCHCAMDITNIRASPSGSGYICRTCLESKSGGLRGVSQSESSSSASKDIFSKKSYFCQDCGYSFERNATFVVSNCPMCAKQDVQELSIESHDVEVDHENDEIIFQ